MARQEAAKHASTKPSEAQRGGTIGIPAGAVATIADGTCWATWGDAGEGAIKGGRSADDPALKIVADVDGAEDQIVEFLGAGKQLVPSDDGEFLDIPAGSGAVAISDSCNANHFLHSVSDVKRHGKNAVSEDLMDEGISKFLVGLKFVAGREIIKRNWADDGQQRAARPTLVCDEIIEQPTSVRKGGKSSASPKAQAAGSGKTAAAKRQPEPEPEPEEAKEDAAEAGDYTEQAEGFVLQVLDLPKWRKGLPIKSAWSAVFNLVRWEDADLREAVTEMVRDREWIADEARPWQVEGEMIVRV